MIVIIIIIIITATTDLDLLFPVSQSSPFAHVRLRKWEPVCTSPVWLCAVCICPLSWLLCVLVCS